MKYEIRIYVSMDGLTGRETSIARLHRFGARMKELVRARDGLGYSAVALLEPTDYEEEDVDREIVEIVTKGRLPAIYLNLTYDLKRVIPGDPEIESLLQEYGFQLALTDRSDD